MRTNLSGAEYLNMIAKILDEKGSCKVEDFAVIARGRNWTVTTFKAKLSMIEAERTLTVAPAVSKGK